MAIKEWSTSYSGASPTQDADPITGVMPDLADETAPGAGDGDEARTSQVEQPRDKLQAVCKLVGDSANAPTGSLAEILDRDHANGDARQLRLRERASDPTAAASKGFLYAKDDGGTTELFYRDSGGTVRQLTPPDTTAPAGDYIEVTDGQPSASIDIGSGDTVIMPSQSFTTLATGDYPFRVVVPWLATSGGGNASIQVKAVFDEAGTPITVGYNDEWQARALDGDYQCATFSGKVTLDAGSHTLKVYAKEVDGSNARILGSATKPGGAVKAALTLAAGTGVEYVQDETTDTDLEAGDAKKTLTNAGAGAKVDYTLPTCAAGLRYRFAVLAAQTLRIVTDSTADDIRIAGSITAGASRYAEAATVGNVLELLGVSDALWLAVAREGTWTLST